ncbi:choice-of-anchor M domain-containing protein [Micrococcus sp.]|uniref:choice-of-anchor M domain-containing protein n=1 Tax=Micrococcus sp. TaxID=1271 RepID=UPI0026DB154B|nr:choice-of-anchor M domain-containing protein [Micrococcus sp.]MDO4240704.1 choice-of-anchor M domain-containing protein [Micrococcus sp.]
MTPSTPAPVPRTALASLAAALAATLGICTAAPAVGTPAVSGLSPATAPSAASGVVDGTDGLAQTVTADEASASDRHVIEAGHVDIGPRVVDGRWTLQLRDDSQATPVWRTAEQTVLRVPDAARLPVPEDQAYAFLGEEPGTPVFVLPQVEDDRMPWPGWSTQHPDALAAMTRGVEFRLESAQGPGRMLMYVDSGAFEGPQVLWDSEQPGGQRVFAEANTHTHANWVFTRPGVYALTVSAVTTSPQGAELRDTRVLRFAVGDATDVEDAFTVDGAAASGPQGGVPDAVWWAAAAAGVLAVAGLIVGLAGRRTRPARARRSAR